MKKLILGLVFTVLTAGTIFAADIIPELQDFVVSKIGADVQLVTLYPNTPLAVEKLSQLRQGGMPELITSEWSIGPSSRPISSSLLELQKLHARVALAASVNAFVRGEAYLQGFNEDMAAKIATQVSATIVFAEILKNSREELRLEYSWKNPDGTTGYGVTFFLAVDKSSIEPEIAAAAKAVASGNNKDDRRTDTVNPVKQTADVKRISEDVNFVSDDLVKSVQALMEGDSRIQRYREENRLLLSFEN